MPRFPRVRAEPKGVPARAEGVRPWVGVSDPGVRGESGRTCGPAGTWTFGAGCVIVGRVGFRLLLPNLRFSPRPWHSFDGAADPVDPLIARPAVCPAPALCESQ